MIRREGRESDSNTAPSRCLHQQEGKEGNMTTKGGGRGAMITKGGGDMTTKGRGGGT